MIIGRNALINKSVARLLLEPRLRSIPSNRILGLLMTELVVRFGDRFHMVLVFDPTGLHLAKLVVLLTELLLWLILLLHCIILMPFGLQVYALVTLTILNRYLIAFEGEFRALLEILHAR